MRVVVAGFGNVLRGDDGFGVTVAQVLLAAGPPSDVTVLEVGIGGIHLVQELLVPAALLVVIDAVHLDRPPGTVVVMRPDVTDVSKLPLMQRRDQLADMHYATPERALMLARGLGVLPEKTWLVGCQAGDVEQPSVGLTSVVAGAVESAAHEVRRLVSDAGLTW